MKKSLFYLAATLLIATTSCSEDNNDDAPKGQESNITLYAPDDVEEFELLYENPKCTHLSPIKTSTTYSVNWA